jgi:hypothetical protein
MNIEQLRRYFPDGQVPETQNECCRACGRNEARIFDIHYIEPDYSCRYFPLCLRCCRIAVFGQEFDDMDVIDEMVALMRDQQIERLVEARLLDPPGPYHITGERWPLPRPVSLHRKRPPHEKD